MVGDKLGILKTKIFVFCHGMVAVKHTFGLRGEADTIFFLPKVLPTLLGGGASPKLTSGKHAEGA